MLTSTINAFQKILPNFSFSAPESYSEEFAQNRFKKKMEVPSNDNNRVLSAECWSNWLSTDEGLPDIHLPSGEWYKARMFLHRNMLPIRLDKFEFPKGSEFIPTLGKNSIEARLCESKWTCTSDNFGHMARVCYGHKALKRAVRRRYSNWFARKGFDITERQADAYLFRQFKNSRRPAFDIFTWKLSRVVCITQGSRFSTVPKNNTNRRPINIEPFGNILTQRAVGLEIRDQIQSIYGLDLDTLATNHRVRIRETDQIATIDLRNASDSVSLSLCKFLLPKNVYSTILKTRSSMVLGPDGSYHLTRKVSSMGNGFTFELMSLILISLCRILDPTSSVFGDDIIISQDKAERLIELLEEVGFQINIDKSFLSGPFRESCGANFHSDEGYIESYDFMYPESIGDCVLIFNKCYRLSKLYKSFKTLYNSLKRCVPHALHGGPSYEFEQCDMLDLVGNGFTQEDPIVTFPLYFVTPKLPEGGDLSDKTRKALEYIQLDPSNFILIPGFEFKSALRSPTRKHLKTATNWAKYEMYLHAGRRTKDVITDRGEWVRVWFVTSGERTFRASSLMT